MMAPALFVRSTGTNSSRRSFAWVSSRLARTAALIALCEGLALPAVPAGAQTGPPAVAASASSVTQPLRGTMAAVPFGVGEHMEYDVKFSSVKVGTGSMEVREITDVRGQPSWHTVFTVQGRALVWLSVNIVLESWFDVTTLSSRRYHQDQRYTGYKKNLTTEIFPERGMFKEEGKEERVTVAQPLDDGSFLYYVRTIPLVVGETYSLAQYYKPEANPVIIHVARREKITTPAGTFNTIVLQPKIKSKGIFGQDGKAEVWLADDSTRMMVQLKSDMPIGSINMFLSKYRAGAQAKPAP